MQFPWRTSVIRALLTGLLIPTQSIVVGQAFPDAFIDSGSIGFIQPEGIHGFPSAIPTYVFGRVCGAGDAGLP
jgi:hypothetical protein